MRIDGRAVHFRSARDARGGRHRHGAPGTVASCRDLVGGRERASRQAAGEPARAGGLARDGRGGAASSSQQLGIDVDPRTPIGVAADRPAAAGRNRPRAVLRRPHHHPRRADLGAVAARGGAAVRRAAPAARRSGTQRHLHLAFPRRHPARSRDTVTVFRNGRKVATAPVPRDRQGLAHRADDRRRPRASSRKATPATSCSHSKPDAPVVHETRGPDAAPARSSDVSLDSARRRGARHLRLHGLRPDRTRAHAVRQDRAGSRHA